MTELILSREYHLDSKTVRSALIKKHFTEHLVKTIIQASLFLVMGIYFTLNLIFTHDSMSIFLMVVCFAFVLVVLLNPILTANSESKIFGRGVGFTFKLYKDGIVIDRGADKKTELPFESISKALDTDDFLYLESNNRFFPVPKNVFADIEVSAITKNLFKNLDERYKNRLKKTNFLNK